jgi:predicted Zn-dependent peptidase
MLETIDINKSKLLFSHIDNIETASIGVFFKTGARFEKKNLKGIAHFLEHMVFKGSRGYSHLKIKREIEGRGGSLNAFTSQEVTAYYAHTLSKNILSSLDILLDMVYYPKLEAEEIKKERNVILEEIKMYNDLPSSRAAGLLDKMLWPRHPLGEEVIGCSQTVKNICKSDLFSFLRQNYVPANMVVSFSGNFSRKKLIKALEEKIKNNKVSGQASLIKPKGIKGVNISVERKNLEQTYLCMGFRSLLTTREEQLTLKLLSIVLGANMSSRLFEELREKRSLCYDISTEVRRYKDSGAFVIHTGLDKKSVLKAAAVIAKVLNSVKRKPVSRNELSRAKDYLLGQTAMTLERPQGRMFYLAEQYLTNKNIADIADIKKIVKNISSECLQRSAGAIFKENAVCLSCVGNIDPKIKEPLAGVIKENLS